MRVLYPINLDRWKFPIATCLRELTVRNPQIDFYSFSSPTSDEDRQLGEHLWSRSHIHKISTIDLLKQSFDIIHHASATPRNLTAATLARTRSLGKCVHIFTAPIQPHTTDDFYKQYVESVRRADVVAAVSHAVANDIHAQLDRKVDAVIPNGVDLQFFSTEAAEPLDCEALGIRQPYVLFVGVLTPRKRPDVFMQVASLMPTIDFVMAGGFYTAEEEAQFTKAAQEHANLKLLGAQSRTRVRSLMAKATALVFPSELEGLPLTVLEALAMGLPVLAQPKSSLPEAVVEDVTGWLLPVDRPQLWADKLNEILQWSDSQRHDFAQQARGFVTKHYSWDTIAQQYADLYQQVSRMR
ncbi:MAG: glycosyltransferase family 4 protein [Leptolyngbyaceae cyanobacterium SL_7_1]|nr:glycosyltransferase family 4 protein [Leptolyngbyaceae cyanobacterium SL_7_1]